MKINVRQKPDVAILDIKGDIDINSSGLVEMVGKVLKTKIKGVVLNLKEVNSIDYVGISLIAVIYKNIVNHNAQLRIYNLPIQVKKIFAIVGLNRVFKYFASEVQAIESLDDEQNRAQNVSEPLRRRFKRIPFKTLIEFKQKFSADDELFQGDIVNLSAEGVFITTEQILRIQDLLMVRLNLLPWPGVIEIDARVSWVADKEVQGKDYPGMGLEFFNINAEEQKKIINFVEKRLTNQST